MRAERGQSKIGNRQSAIRKNPCSRLRLRRNWIMLTFVPGGHSVTGLGSNSAEPYSLVWVSSRSKTCFLRVA